MKPNPPASPGEQHIAHVILYQAPQPQDRQGLVSAVYTNGHDVFIHRTAHCLPLRIHRQQCIEVADVPADLFNHRIETVYIEDNMSEISPIDPLPWKMVRISFICA